MATQHTDRTLPEPRDAARNSRARLVRSVLGAGLVALALTAALATPPHRVLAAGVPALASGMADTSGTVATSGTPGATGTADATKSVTPTPTTTFARMAGSKLYIHFPAPADKLVAVGFHQASNTKSVRFVPTMTCHKIDKAAKTKALLKRDKKLKLFQQPLRGRGDSNLTAADCAVPPKTVVFAPVDGVVTNVRHYMLYGYIYDLRLEIKPDGSPHLRVVMIHITGVKVKKGDRVVGGVTPVAVVRHLPFVSTINRFVPVKPIDHVHVQVNLDTFKGSF
ncbi:MAG: hypothetical protein P4L93_00725 [Coriobacteriia bacterium]|nr:hypothetical protein [Coriobacteriia bacterium]